VTVERTRAQDSFQLIVHVVPGDPVIVESVDVSLSGPGAQDPDLLAVKENFPLHPRTPLRHELYEEGKGALKAKALDQGYLKADYVVHEILVDRENHQAFVSLVLDTGPLYRFGDVFFEGADDYPQRFVYRYLGFNKGDVFSYEKLGQTQLNFLDSDRFSDVVITPGLDASLDEAVPIDIQLTPSPRHRLKPGVGYGTDTGARFSLRYTDVNCSSLGHKLDADLMLAEFKQSATLSYTLPSYRYKEAFTVFRFGLDRENVDTYTTRSIYTEAERVTYLGRGRLGSVFLRLQQEDYTVGGENSRSRLVIPGVRFSSHRYDDTIRPTHGYQLKTEVRGASDRLGSDTTLLQFWGKLSVLTALPFRLSFLSRIEAGTTWQDDPFEEVPPSLRFFAGGDNSIRGYGYQSLGPVNADGEVVGGKHLLVGSVELEKAIGANWGLAAFYDAGNAYDSLFGIKWAQGAGVGIRRYTVVGPIKVDIARQIGVANPGFRLHVSLGVGW